MLAVVTSGCGGTTASSQEATSSVEAAPTPTAIAPTPSPVDASPSPSPVASLAISDLPRVDLADVGATAVCDPEPSQANLDAGESTIYCADGLELALRAVLSLTRDPVTRIYLRRPDCAAVPCSEDELSTAVVTVWAGAQVLSVRLDSRLEAVSQPQASENSVWPSAGGGKAPDVARPSIHGAPSEVANRDAYPYCGRAEIGDPPEVLGCFRDAVLGGRKAEMTQRVYGTEGGEMLWIYRYEGQGRLIRYSHDQTVGGDGKTSDAWGRSEGAMILGITPLAWDFDPWYGTQVKL